MKKIISLFLAILLMIMLVACNESRPNATMMEPQIVQMRSICELATMKCYYHNVAKFFQDGGEGWMGIEKKDKHFWIEYAGVVTVGIDASLVSMNIQDNLVLITMPPATVQNAEVDKESLNKSSYIVDKESAKIEAADETAAVDQAQVKMKTSASEDTALLENAQQRAKSLLEDYVTNVGKAVGVDYQIAWIYVDEQGVPLNSPDVLSTQPTETLGE